MAGVWKPVPIPSGSRMLVAVVMLCNALRPSTSNLTVPCETWSFLMIVIRAHSQFSRPTLPSLAEVDGYCLSSRGLSRNLILHSEVTSLQWRYATIFAFHVGDMITFSAWSSEPCEGLLFVGKRRWIHVSVTLRHWYLNRELPLCKPSFYRLS